jgi:hypothetical protein
MKALIISMLKLKNGKFMINDTCHKILKMDCSEEEKLGMLFSNRMDAMNVLGEGVGAVTTKVWGDLFQDLIAWKESNTTGQG